MRLVGWVLGVLVGLVLGATALLAFSVALPPQLAPIAGFLLSIPISLVPVITIAVHVVLYVLASIGFAVKWAILLGTVLALVLLNPLAGLIVAIYGGCVAAAIHWLTARGCSVPRLLSPPF